MGNSCCNQYSVHMLFMPSNNHNDHHQCPENVKPVKLLLLGASESGKSTLLKILHASAFVNADERKKYRFSVYSMLSIAMERLLQGAGKFVIHWEYPQTERAIADLRYYLSNQQEFDPLESERVSAIVEKHRFFSALKTLWADPALHRDLLPNCNQFQMLECTEYFLNSLERISCPDYVPSVQDILMMRTPTNGIAEFDFMYNRFHFRVFDVGGQRTERRKWIHCFDNVDAIIFMSAISEFDQILEDDDRTNRLLESIEIFRVTCNAQWFIKTPIILFLNKKDLFAKKIAKKSIQCLFTSYRGSNSYNDQISYVEKRFLKCNMNIKKQIFTHQTCATNTDQMENVLKDVFELVLMEAYKKISLY